MTEKEFFEAVKDGVLEQLQKDDPSITGSVQQVKKVNDVTYNGLSLRSPNTRVMPILYLDDYYRQFAEGDITVSQAVSHAVQVCRKHIMNGANMKVEWLSDYNDAKDRLVPAICNTAACTEYLSNRPSEQFHDLSIYYKILVDIDDNTDGSVAVTNELLSSWGITYDELKEQAWRNIHNINGPLITPMAEIIKEMLPEQEGEEFYEKAQDDYPLFVLTSQNHIGGAVYMADMDVLKGISDDLGIDDYVILPCSREEVIIMPVDPVKASDHYTDYKDMVVEINHDGHTISPDIFLGDSVYLFSKSSGCVEIAA